jgi:hypothetical protein
MKAELLNPQDDNAEKEFLKALRQPLINQTPLQAMSISKLAKLLLLTLV